MLPPFFLISCLHVFLGLTFNLFPSFGVHSVIRFVPSDVLHSSHMTCPYSSHFSIFVVISFILVASLIFSFLMLFFMVMFNIVLPMLHWVTARLLSWCVVRVHVSAPNVIAVSIIFLLRHNSIFLSFKKNVFSKSCPTSSDS